VAHLEDREEVICEALGLAGGWNCTLDMLRGGYNQLACLGATTFIPHAFFQTVENPRVECPPSFFYQNPYWKYYDRLAALTDRLSLFNRIGRHVAPALVYYPIESLWMDSTGGKGQRTFPWQHSTLGNRSAEATINGFNDLVDGLFNSLWDVDIADGKALESARIVQTETGPRITIGHESYRVLLFPPVRAVAPSALRIATDFAKAGGVVIWTGRLPETAWPALSSAEWGMRSAECFDPWQPQTQPGGGSSPADRVSRIGEGTAAFFAKPKDVFTSLAQLVSPEIIVASGDSKGLLVSHRRTESADLYLCFNDSDQALNCTLVLPHAPTPSAWLRLDAETRQINGLVTSATSSVPLDLPPQASTVLLCAKHVGWDLPHRKPADVPKTTLQLEGPWTIQVAGSALDETWSVSPGETTVELPAFRHRAREFQRHAGWEQPDYDDSGWEQVYTVRDQMLFVHASPVLLRGVLPPGAQAIETPLPVTGEYVVYVNGIEMEKRLGQSPQSGRINISKAARGIGDVIAIETTSHSGPAGLTGPVRVVCGPVQIDKLQPWSQWSFPWYTGRVLYRTQFSVPRQANDGRVFLDLGQVRHYVEIWLNGNLVGALLWPPYRIELTSHLNRDANELVLVVANSIANRFAWDQWGTRGTAKPEPSGILGPVRLLMSEE
jgi:hypothetical protein